MCSLSKSEMVPKFNSASIYNNGILSISQAIDTQEVMYGVYDAITNMLSHEIIHIILMTYVTSNINNNIFTVPYNELVYMHVYSHLVVCLLSCFSLYFYPPQHIPLVAVA